jgi:hypothetical protein
VKPVLHLRVFIGLATVLVAFGHAGAAEPRKATARVGATVASVTKGAKGGAGGVGGAPEAPKITSVSPSVAALKSGTDITVVLRGANFGGGNLRVRYKPHPAGEGTCEPSSHDDGEIVCSISRSVTKDLLPNEPLHFIVSATGVDGQVRASEPSSDTLTPLTPSIVTAVCWGEQPIGRDVQLRLRGRGFVVNKSSTPSVEVWTAPDKSVSCNNAMVFGSDDLVCYLPLAQRELARHITVRRPGEPPVPLSAATEISTLACKVPGQ